ncbi:S53 family peptidase [Kribbella sp. NPDC050459]|uniref:S53 family peptidase n=1 Tax=Kribbella sp. NPDC050459 TaxID=3155785 RepID=UPI0033E4433A
MSAPPSAIGTMVTIDAGGMCRGMSEQASARGWRWSSVCAVIALAALVTSCTSSPKAKQTSDNGSPNPAVHLVAAAPGVVTFYLALPYNANSLTDAATKAASPGPEYRHFVPLARAGGQYGATDKDISTVGDAVTGLGLGFAVDPTRLFARVFGTPAQWQKALGSPLGQQAGSASNPFVTYSLPDEVPDQLQSSGTTLLVGDADVYDAASDGSRPSSINSPDATKPGAEAWPVDTGSPLTASCQNPLLTAKQVYTPAQILDAYGIDQLTARAKGTPVVTVIDLGGGWSDQDLALAGQCWGYAPPAVAQSQGDGVPTRITNVDDETSLDLQTVAAVVPGGQLRLVQTTNGDAAFLDGFSRAIADPKGQPDVLTVSYGGCAIAEQDADPGYVKVVDSVLAMAALTGVATLIAAGDSGSTTCGAAVAGTTMSYPAVSPFVTAVGGTRLVLGQGNERTGEVVWNDSVYGGQGAGGGGTSRTQSKPWYQSKVNPGPMRTVPDGAALADMSPGWPVVLDGALQTVGGTSGATPFTAAALALVSANERAAGRPPIGLANGWFYSVEGQSGTFYDVTEGNNDLESVGCCQAAPGYDRASGLGVPHWATLPATVPAVG